MHFPTEITLASEEDPVTHEELDILLKYLLWRLGHMAFVPGPTFDSGSRPPDNFVQVMHTAANFPEQIEKAYMDIVKSVEKSAEMERMRPDQWGRGGMYENAFLRLRRIRRIELANSWKAHISRSLLGIATVAGVLMLAFEVASWLTPSLQFQVAIILTLPFFAAARYLGRI